MFLLNHGGSCCGIKTLQGFMSPPAQVLPAREVLNNSSMKYVDPRPRPEETARQRLEAAIAPFAGGQGIIEAVLNDNRSHYIYYKKERPSLVPKFNTPEEYRANTQYSGQHGMWHDTLIELGFDLVNVSLNTNSTNHIYIYHLVRNKKTRLDPMMTAFLPLEVVEGPSAPAKKIIKKKSNAVL